MLDRHGLLRLGDRGRQRELPGVGQSGRHLSGDPCGEHGHVDLGAGENLPAVAGRPARRQWVHGIAVVRQADITQGVAHPFEGPPILLQALLKSLVVPARDEFAPPFEPGIGAFGAGMDRESAAQAFGDRARATRDLYPVIPVKYHGHPSTRFGLEF